MVFVTLVSSSRSKERSQIWRRSCPQDSNPDSVVLRNVRWRGMFWLKVWKEFWLQSPPYQKFSLPGNAPKVFKLLQMIAVLVLLLCADVFVLVVNLKNASFNIKLPVHLLKKRWELCNFHRQDCNSMRPSQIPIKEPCNIFVQVNLTWAVVQQDSQPVLWRHRGHRLEKEQWSRKTSRGEEKRWITQIRKKIKIRFWIFWVSTLQ